MADHLCFRYPAYGRVNLDATPVIGAPWQDFREPSVHLRKWDYGAPGEKFPCWRVMSHAESARRSAD